MRKSLYPKVVLILALLSGCHSSARLNRVFVVDTQGFSQTITTAQALEKFEKVDFLAPQPYQKVMRTWKLSDKEGDKSILTSYYPSIQVMQYLEGQGGRAFGSYKEWHENGQLKVVVSVVGGKFDLGEAAEGTWIFDGLSKAFDEEGHTLAQIPYVKGSKEGTALFYYSQGSLSEEIMYEKNKLHGFYKAWYKTGQLFRSCFYSQNLLEGESLSWWPENKRQSREIYNKGALQEGVYWDIQGNLVAEVRDFRGQRAIFNDERLSELQTIENGVVSGWVGFFGKSKELEREIYVKEGMKNGPEILFYPSREGKKQPKIMMNWSQDVLQGMIRTWFPNGQIESERHIVKEELSGPYVAYYPNGSIRVLEEYDKGRLIEGKYFALDSLEAVSRVQRGQGKATFFDENGSLLKEVMYQDGEPCLSPSDML